VVNVLIRRHGWDPDGVVEAIRELDELGIQTVSPDRPLLLVALDLAVAHDISAYNAAHLALAEATDAVLITLDGRVARVAGARSLIRPRPGASPAGASNGRVAGAPDRVPSVLLIDVIGAALGSDDPADIDRVIGLLDELARRLDSASTAERSDPATEPTTGQGQEV
jgi:hypothetical protein